MLARHRDPRVVPLEVWDLVIDGTPLYLADRHHNFGAVLGRVAEDLIDGTALSESLPNFPPACRTIEQVVLVGGAARDVAWTCARVPALHAADPELCAEQGGHAILARAGKRGLVVDLGQSQLKISGPQRRVLPRDLTEIPISGRPVAPIGRAALVTWVADALRDASHGQPPEALVFALPCEIDPDGAPGTCSYPWSAGDPIVPDILAAAGLAHLPTWLLNDAELAAIGVASRGPVTRTTLVLTLGFGVGGALLLADPSSSHHHNNDAVPWVDRHAHLATAPDVSGESIHVRGCPRACHARSARPYVLRRILCPLSIMVSEHH